MEPIKPALPPSRALLIRFSSGGDIVLLSALVRCLHKAWPDSELDVLVRSDMKELVHHNPRLANKFYWPSNGDRGLIQELVRALQSREYNLLIDEHASIRSRTVCRLLRTKQVVRLRKKSIRRLLLTGLKINLLKKRDFMMLEYFKPLTKWGFAYDLGGTEIHVSMDRKQKISQTVLNKSHIKTWVGIAPGASFPKKAYPMEWFRQIALQLLQQTDCGLMMFGGKDEEKLWLPNPNDRVLDFQANADMQEAAHAAGHCRVVLTNDSLMMHLAEAAGTNVVALFGPTVREFGYFPYRPRSKALEVNLWCRPCSRHGQGSCFRREQYCFARIRPEQVLEEVKAHLNEKSRVD